MQPEALGRPQVRPVDVRVVHEFARPRGAPVERLVWLASITPVRLEQRAATGDLEQRVAERRHGSRIRRHAPLLLEPAEQHQADDGEHGEK